MTDPKRSPRELIITVAPEAGLRVSEEGLWSLTDASIQELEEMLAAANARLKPAFGLSEDFAKERMSSVLEWDDPSLFYRVIADEQRLEQIASRLLHLSIVDSAFIKPGAELPLIYEPVPAMRDALLTLRGCDFTHLQEYRGPAPVGIDSDFAQTLPGGAGHLVNIIDVEKGWCFTHSDLLQNPGGLLAGVASTDGTHRDHGTAVLGLLGGDVNDFGVTGISPEATIRTVSVLGNQATGGTSDWGPAAAITLAAGELGEGDILIVELQEAGPDQGRSIPIEWWPDNLLAIKYATNRGVIVVEAGGNGGKDLGDPIYDVPEPVFPAFWRNPFRRNPIDSGAIIVGAGAPPSGFNGTSHGPGRSRLPRSNYGCMFDAQGWGHAVTTCGFGDQNCGAAEEFKYTVDFGGTSSATPIVAGALACVQSILKAAGENPLTPGEARTLLRATGSAQTDGPNGPASQRIGNLPDIRSMVSHLGL